MRIIYPPSWMNELHWLLMGSTFVGLSVYCWLLFWERRNVVSMAYGVAWTSAAVIAWCFFVIQSEVFGWSPVILFAIERAFWWPMALAAAAIVDIHAADFNGHRSLIARIDQAWERRRGRHEPHFE